MGDGDVTGGLQFTYISLDDYRIVVMSCWEKADVVLMIGKMCLIRIHDTATVQGWYDRRTGQRGGADIQVVTLPVAAIPRARV